VGDFNTGRRGIDEACSYFNEREDQFMGAMTADGWVDAFRHMQGERRVYSWGRRIAGEMCGLRVDHAFVSPSLVPYLAACDLHTVEGASDHAALIVDIAAP
jgi:exonuclease III